jgi:hypothetical protein
MVCLKVAVAWYKRLGIKTERVMTDNGSCYRSKVFNKPREAMGYSLRQHKTTHAQNQRQGRVLYPVKPQGVSVCPSL